MKRRTPYVKAPRKIAEVIVESEVVEDFLPSPDELVLKEENVKVTLELSKRSVSLFKRFAQKRGYKYQRMIRNLLDQYAERSLSKHLK